MWKKLKEFLFLTIFAIIFFGIIFTLQTFIGSSIFSLLRVKFLAIKDLFVFTFIFCILSAIVELFTDSFIEIIKDFKNLNKKLLFSLNFFVSVPIKVIIILLTDILSKNVEITFLAALIGATILFLIEYKTEDFLENLNDKLDAQEKEKKQNAIADIESALDTFEKEQKNNHNNNKK